MAYDIGAFVSSMGVTIEDAAPLYTAYIEEMDSMKTELQEALDRQDYNLFTRTMHNLKGINANLDIQDILEPATTLYHELQNGEYDNAGAGLQAIYEQYEEVRANVTNVYDLR